MPLRIETPAIQNWSCHGCTDCCRGGFLIELSEAEKQRIEEQGWKEEDGLGPGSWIVSENGIHRLNHKADGACVFLDGAGRCRIHAKFGEAAKPRACRLYPLVFHPRGNQVVAGLRFSCPSAARNLGKPLSAQLPALRELAELVVPEGYAEIPAPPIVREGGLNWPDFLRYVAWLDKIMAAQNVALPRKLERALHWINAVEKAEFDHLTGREADEILGALYQCALGEIPPTGQPQGRVTGIRRLLFRTLIYTYARRDSVDDVNTPLMARLKWLASMARFARASGKIPALIPEWPQIDFAAVEKTSSELTPEAEATLTRFFRVKIQTLHFCGRAYYDCPLVEGFRALALLYPVMLWLARWKAAASGRSAVSNEDIERAIILADRHHGYAPILGMPSARKRVRLLAQNDGIARLF